MRRVALIILVILIGGSVHAGVVRMLDGTRHEGLIGLEEKGQLSVRTAAGAVVRVELDRVLSAQFQGSSLAPAIAPRRWIGRDLGVVRGPGSVRFVEDTATVRGSGAEMEGNSESGYYVYQAMDGDGQIVARVAGVQKTDRRALAGLMIRANAEVGVPYAMVMAYAEDGTRFQHRTRLGAGTPRVAGASKVPCWLKLVRRGNSVAGYASDDGQDWQQIGSETIQLPPRALIGLVVCARSNDSICTATFERVTVTPGIDPQVVSSGPGAFRGVRLRQGSLVGGQIRGLSDSAVRLWRDREVSIPAAEVAYVQFASMGANLAAKLQAGRKGVLLANGDFVEGDVVGIEGDRLKLSSVLFGLQRLEVGRAVAAVLRESARAATRYEVRVADGSILLSDRISIEGGNLGIEVPAFGVLQFPAGQVVEIRAGEARFRSLAEMTPAKVEAKDAGVGGRGYVANGTMNGVAMSLGGQACGQGIGLQAGTGVTYALNGGYSILMFRAGVPDGILPTAAVRFVVQGDGREIYRSPDRTSVDEALAVTVKVGGVKELVLRVESSGADVPGASGLFGDPALVK